MKSGNIVRKSGKLSTKLGKSELHPPLVIRFHFLWNNFINCTKQIALY